MIREPIAVVGIGLRLPGAECPRELWALLRDGVDATGEFPADRWEPSVLAGLPSGRAGSIAGFDEADPAALQLLKRELRQMDPQHRILLECAWRALEDAGIPPHRPGLSEGERTGVFVGVNFSDFQRMLSRDWSRLDGYSLLGATNSFAANRISHAFDLRGPSVCVNAGCASSTLAIHDACRALALGEVDVALAGGVELMLSPDASMMLAQAGVLSKSGRCRTLDARADGYVRGEGAGVVVLKPLAKLGPRDRVHALIRATAANHNGHNEWIMAANLAAQQRVIAEGCRLAGVEGSTVDYVEVHGSAFAGGDAIEARAIAEALRPAAGPAGRPCRLGAISNNLGYLGPASGVASLIKVCLALRERTLVPTIHVEQPNPAIDPERLSVQRTLEPWPEAQGGTPRRAGVLSTSLGGANAFVLLEAAELRSEVIADTDAQILLLSAHQPELLATRVEQMIAWLPSCEASLARVCATAGEGRRHHRHRVAMIAERRDAMLVQLQRCRAALRSGEALRSSEALRSGHALDRLWCEDGAPTKAIEAARAWLEGGAAPRFAEVGPWAELPIYPFARERLWPEWLTRTLVSRSPSTSASPSEAPRANPSTTLDLAEFLRERLAELLELEPAQVDTRERSVFELGLDSIGVVELCDRIARELAIELPVTAVFEHPHVESLAARLAELRGSTPAPRSTSTPTPMPTSMPAPRVDASEQAIAIVGIGCRLPGGIVDGEGLAELVFAGRSAIGELPAERRALLAGAADLIARRPAGFVADVERFDAEFFRITRREAEGVDPQQRLFLEVAWEALEHAGVDPSSLAGTRTGVFAGVHAHDYALLAEQFGREAAQVGPHWSTGVDASYVAGRLAYALGLVGPCMAVDTACSSSLAAIHLACQSLRSGESSLAIAGGVKLTLAAHLGVFLHDSGALSPSGRCRAFDADADGMVQGEGCGVVILERLSDAIRKGDRVLATIRATAINHDGASGGLTVPNPRAQADLYREALARAGIAGEQLDYLEAHGTGTKLGDPIELEGIARVYGGRERARPLLLGSVKANLGHAEAAAGVIGLIAATQVLARGEAPPVHGFARATPAFAWAGAAIEVPRERRRLAEVEGRRHFAAVSSFGMSGINAHAILEAAPARAPASADAGPWLLAFSARDPAALRELAERHASTLARALEPGELADYCFGALAGRAAFAARAAVVGDSQAELREQLRAWLDGRSTSASAAATDELARGLGLTIVEGALRGAVDPAIDRRTLASTLAALHRGGVAIDPRLLYPAARRGAALPRYPWQRQRYWWDGQFDAHEATHEAASVAVEPSTATREPPVLHLHWRPGPSPSSGPLGRWLIVDGERERAAVLAELVEHAGGVAQTTSPGRLADALRSSGPVQGVAWMLADDPTNPSETSQTSEWIRDRSLELGAAVRVLAPLDPPPRLVIVGRGAWAVGEGERPAIGQAALWGLGRVIGYEHGSLRCRRVDLDPRADRWLGLQELVEVLGDPGDDDELALRDGARHLPRLELEPELEPATIERVRFDPERSYLITGGLGALGLQLAAWLIDRGARRLALLGRSSADASQAEQLAALAARGASISTPRVDVADPAALAEVASKITAELGPIAGVFHAAGVLADGLLAELDAAAFDRVLRPKVAGALALHGLFSTRGALDHFVLVSSTAGTIGAAGQANYAAANALLDALAQARRAAGLPGLAIAWGPWAEVGMAARDERRGARLAERGLISMTPAAALAPLDRLLVDPRTPADLAIVELDADRWIAAHPSVRTATRLLGLRRTEDPVDADAGRSSLRERCLAASGAGRRERVEAGLLAMLSEVSRVPRSRLRVDEPLERVGLDSLMALELRDLVGAGFGVELPLASFVDARSSIATLSAELLDRLALASSSPANDSPTHSPTRSRARKEVLL